MYFCKRIAARKRTPHTPDNRGFSFFCAKGKHLSRRGEIRCWQALIFFYFSAKTFEFQKKALYLQHQISYKPIIFRTMAKIQDKNAYNAAMARIEDHPICSSHERNSSSKDEQHPLLEERCVIRLSLLIMAHPLFCKNALSPSFPLEICPLQDFSLLL